MTNRGQSGLLSVARIVGRVAHRIVSVAARAISGLGNAGVHPMNRDIEVMMLPRKDYRP